jgi:hypothetical protein
MEEYKIHWPDVKKSIFSMSGDHSDSSTKAFIEHAIDQYNYSDAQYANMFEAAADLIVCARQCEIDEQHKHADSYFVPVMFMYRHAIELWLKITVRELIKGGLIKDDSKIKKQLGSHDIKNLWNICRPGIENRWPDGDKNILDNVESTISDIHKFDPNGQGLRYSRETNGDITCLNYPKIVRLELLKDAAKDVISFIGAVSGCNNL